MATSSEGSQPTTDAKGPEKLPRMLSEVEGKRGIGIFRHLFGPVALVATICLVVIAILLFWKMPDFPTLNLNLEKIDSSQPIDLKLFDYQLKDYKDGLVRLDAYLGLQALFIAMTVLIIIRRSDSLNLFGNSIPLSWLHVFIPVLLIYLWLASGYIVHELVWGRIQGVATTIGLHPSNAEYTKLFRDAGWIDGWLISFVDNHSKYNLSGIDRRFSGPTVALLVIVLGTLISAAHASTLALVSIGCRRYLSTRQRRRLLLYYVLPLAPLVFLLISHFLFAYGGSNRNWFQLYVAAVSMPLMAFLLWLSAKIDDTSYPETLECLTRARQLTLSGPVERLPLRDSLGSVTEGTERTIALIGDSLSMAFHVSSLLPMLVRMRRGWKTNWFLTLPAQAQVSRSVLARLSDFGAVTGVQHASVSAMVNSTKRRSALNYLTGTYHFSHQVDEVLAAGFPNILLVWIGNNDVDWRWKAKSFTRELILELSNTFVQSYEVQLRRLLDGALKSDNRSVLVIFGLTNFKSFFRARADAESMRNANNSLFPHLESAYRFFVSMRPEYRAGMIELAAVFNEKLEAMCERLGEQLSGTTVRLVFSNTMSVTKIDSATFLSSVDAWHPSISGHSMLADSVYPIVYEQVKFLGWD